MSLHVGGDAASWGRGELGGVGQGPAPGPGGGDDCLPWGVLARALGGSGEAQDLVLAQISEHGDGGDLRGASGEGAVLSKATRAVCPSCRMTTALLTSTPCRPGVRDRAQRRRHRREDHRTRRRDDHVGHRPQERRAQDFAERERHREHEQCCEDDRDAVALLDLLHEELGLAFVALACSTSATIRVTTDSDASRVTRTRSAPWVLRVPAYVVAGLAQQRAAEQNRLDRPLSRSRVGVANATSGPVNLTALRCVVLA